VLDESAECGRRIVMEHLTEDERQMVNGGKWRAQIVKYGFERTGQESGS